MVTDPGQMEEPDVVLGQLGRAAELPVSPLAAGGRVLVNVGGSPFRVGRQIAERRLRAFWSYMKRSGLEDRLAGERAIG